MTIYLDGFSPILFLLGWFAPCCFYVIVLIANRRLRRQAGEDAKRIKQLEDTVDYVLRDITHDIAFLDRSIQTPMIPTCEHAFKVLQAIKQSLRFKLTRVETKSGRYFEHLP